MSDDGINKHVPKHQIPRSQEGGPLRAHSVRPTRAPGWGQPGEAGSSPKGTAWTVGVLWSMQAVSSTVCLADHSGLA